MILAKDVAATTENVRKPVTENVLVGGAESHSGFGVTTERYVNHLDLSNLFYWRCWKNYHAKHFTGFYDF